MTAIKAVPCEVWSRVVGYYRPVRDWHYGKQQEFKERHQMMNKDIERAVKTAESSAMKEEP